MKQVTAFETMTCGAHTAAKPKEAAAKPKEAATKPKTAKPIVSVYMTRAKTAAKR
jgi:hypothetical protein